MNSPRLRYVALALLTSGCPLFYDIDDAVLSEADTGVDLEQTRDDGADSSDLVDVVLPRGQTCSAPGSIEGTCDPVVQDCSPDRICDFQFVSQEPLTFRTGCADRGETTFDLELGAGCSPDSTTQKCMPGLLCRIDTCARLCRRSDAGGCSPAEFCTAFSDAIGGYGICAAECQIP